MKIISKIILVLVLCAFVAQGALYAVSPASYKVKRNSGARLSAFDARQTSGNNLSFYISNTGFLATNPNSPFAPGGFWPSGSTDNYVYQSGLNLLGIIDADGDGVYADTVETSAVYDAEWREGRADGFRDDPEAAVFFSTDGEDIALWPDEFRILDNDPDSPTFGNMIPHIIGDQDIVGYFTDIAAPVFQSAGRNRLGAEVAQRIVLISTGVERDVMYIHWKIRNASRYNQDAAGPYDLRGVLVDIKTDFDIGGPSDDASAILPSRQTALAYDSDFNETDFGRQPAIIGTSILASPTDNDGIDNPTVLSPSGNGMVDETFADIMAAGLTDPLTGEPYEFPQEVLDMPAERFFLYTMYTFGDLRPDPFSDAEAYRILSAAPGENLLPRFNPYASFLEATIVGDLRQNFVSGPFDLAPDADPAEVWAMFYFSPATSDPDINNSRADLSDLAPDGEFSRALELERAARLTFESGFLRPEAPVAPDFRLVPGDRQVTITWDDLPLTTTRDDYAVSQQAAQLVLRDSLPDGFPRITGYRENDFEGFRVYRSLTGERDNARLIASFDLDNGVTDYTVTRTLTVDGFTGTGPLLLKLGADSGIRFSYVDRGEDIGGLVNGAPVFYTVTSYDFNPYNYQGESLESNIGFKRQDSQGNFIQQVTPRENSSSYRRADWANELTGGDGGALTPGGARIAPDTLGSSSDTVTTDPLDPTNRSVVRQNVVVDFPGAPAAQVSAIVSSGLDIVYGQALPDSGVFMIDSVEAAGPATRLFNMYYHWRDSFGRVVGGSVAGESFTYNSAERFNVFHFDGRSDSLGVTYSGSIELYRGGRADAKVAPLRVNGVRGTLLSPGVAYPHHDYRFTAEPAVVGFDGAPFVVYQPMNIEQLNSEFIAGESARTTSNMAAWAPGDIEIVWESDTRLASVRDLTHKVDIRFSEFTDDGWGFLPLDEATHEEMIWQSLHVHPKHKRSFNLKPDAVYYAHPQNPDSVSMAFYVRGVELFVTNIVERPSAGDTWLLRCDFNSNNDPVQTSPVPGQRMVFHFERATDNPQDENLNRVRVVPNPYIISSPLDAGPGNKVIQFVGLPPECKIRIYTISGILVNVLEHGPGVPESSYGTFDSGSGQRRFDLRTRFGLEMASGTYFFHVESKSTGEEFTGKFSIIN